MPKLIEAPEREHNGFLTLPLHRQLRVRSAVNRMGTTTRKKAEASGEAQAEQPKRGKRQRSTSPTEAQAPAAKSRRRKTHTAETESGRTGKKKEPAGSQSNGAGKARAAPTAAAPKAARGRGGAQAAAPSAASTAPITINRAPVLTLWVAVVAQRQGFSWEEALTFGKEVSGILAQSKGRSLGIYEAKERSEASARAAYLLCCPVPMVALIAGAQDMA